MVLKLYFPDIRAIILLRIFVWFLDEIFHQMINVKHEGFFFTWIDVSMRMPLELDNARVVVCILICYWHNQ